MAVQKSILIIYDYFFPGYKAGGPVQSLTNLIGALKNEYSFSVVTTAYDLLSEVPYDSIKLNSWNEVLIPGVQKKMKIWYAEKRKPSIKELIFLIKSADPSIIYLNGIYSYRLFLQVLLVNKFAFPKKIVACPRGMLQQGALSVKSRKKKYYLKFLQKTNLLNKIVWHATNQEEANDIEIHFPQNNGIFVASNIPKTPVDTILPIYKKSGELKVVYLSLISEKKNLLLLLNLIKDLPEGIVLEIYGPVKDPEYWKACKALINKMGNKAVYKGDLEPVNVQHVLSTYHAMILLTKGENFGHAAYESLSVGRPLITSYFTPWNHLFELQAGANVDITNVQDCRNIITDFAAFSQNEYNLFCSGALKLAIEYFSNLNSAVQYRNLFKSPK